MRLVMYLLLIANVALALMIWLDYRGVRQPEVYKEKQGVHVIQLLQRGLHDNGLVASERCWLFGPESDRKVVELLKVELSSIDYFSKIVETEVKKAPGYWVYFGPLENEQASRAQLREFQSKGIDSFIIRRKDLNGSISLGVFENIDSANRMLKIMQRKGYVAKMTEIPKSEKEFWLQLKYPKESDLEARFLSYLDTKKTALESREIFCK